MAIMRSISREDLFKDAWTRPLSRIAAEFGVSDTALRKMCDRHDIPTPGRGYWAQIASGKSFPRPALRPAAAPHLETVRIVGAVQPSPDVKAIIDRVKAERSATPRPEQVVATTAKGLAGAADEPGSIAEIHPLVQRTYARLAGAAAKGEDIVHLSGKGLFTVAAAPARADRMGGLLTLLVGAMETRGWAVEDGEKGLHLVPDGEPITFDITEQTERVRHQITEAEQAALRKYEEARERAMRRASWSLGPDRPAIPEWDYVPTGRFVLSLAEGTLGARVTPHRRRAALEQMCSTQPPPRQSALR